MQITAHAKIVPIKPINMNIPSNVTYAMQTALSDAYRTGLNDVERTMVKDVADFIMERLEDSDDEQNDDVNLHDIVSTYGEMWADSRSEIVHLGFLVEWYSFNHDRFKYADEALQDSGKEKVNQALRSGYYLYLLDVIVTPLIEGFSNNA